MIPSEAALVHAKAMVDKAKQDDDFAFLVMAVDQLLSIVEGLVRAVES